MMSLPMLCAVWVWPKWCRRRPKEPIKRFRARIFLCI